MRTKWPTKVCTIFFKTTEDKMTDKIVHTFFSLKSWDRKTDIRTNDYYIFNNKKSLPTSYFSPHLENSRLYLKTSLIKKSTHSPLIVLNPRSLGGLLKTSSTDNRRWTDARSFVYQLRRSLHLSWSILQHCRASKRLALLHHRYWCDLCCCHACDLNAAPQLCDKPTTTTEIFVKLLYYHFSNDDGLQKT